MVQYYSFIHLSIHLSIILISICSIDECILFFKSQSHVLSSIISTAESKVFSICYSWINSVRGEQ